MSAPTDSFEFGELLVKALDANSQFLMGNTSTNNLFRVAQETIARLLDGSNTINVYENADFPDAHQAAVLGVQDNGSGKVQVLTLSETDYLDGQRIQLLNQSVSAYDGFHDISNVEEGEEHIVTVTSQTRDVTINTVTNQWATINRTNNSVEIFDLTTNALLKTIPTLQTSSEGIVWDTGLNKILVMSNSNGGTLSVVDPVGETVNNVSMGGTAQRINVNSTTNKAYIPLFSNQEVVVFNTNTEVIIKTLTSGDGIPTQPIDAGIDETNNEIIIVGHSGTLVKINGSTDLVIDTLVTSLTFIDSIALNDVTGKSLIPARSTASAIILDNSSFTEDEIIPVSVSGGLLRDAVVDKALNVYYVADVNLATINVIIGTTNTQVETIDTSFDPNNMAINTNNNDLFVTTSTSTEVMIFDLHTFDIEDLTFTATSQGEAVRVIPVGTGYVRLAPLTTTHGYIFEDGATNQISSPNFPVNTITLLGTNITAFTAVDPTFLDLGDMVIIDATNTNKLFNITSDLQTSTLLGRKITCANFDSLGNIDVAVFIDRLGMVSYNNGLELNSTPGDILNIIFTGGAVGSSVVTVNHLEAELLNLGKFQGQLVDGAFILNINPLKPIDNKITISDIQTTGVGQVFKPGTELTGDITGFSDLGGGVVRVDQVGHGYDIGKAGQFVEIFDNSLYNKIFEITVTTADIYTIVTEFLGDTSGAKSKQVRNITAYVANNLSNIVGVSVTLGGGGGPVFNSPTSLSGILQVGMTINVVGSTFNLYNGQQVVTSIDFDNDTFEIDSDFLGLDTSLIFTPLRMQITVPNHNLTGTTNIDLQESILYSKGQPAEFLDVDNLILPLQPFISSESIGKITDGSLTQDALNIKMPSVTGEANSNPLGSVLMKGNVVETVIDTIDTWTDVNLGGLAVESKSNTKHRLIDNDTGELKQTEPNPLSGDIKVEIDAVSSGGTQEFHFRIVKNNGETFDGKEAFLDIGNSILPVSITASENTDKDDTVKLQVKNVDGDTNLTLVTYSMMKTEK